MPTLPVTPIELATALCLVVIGSIIQGSIGFGLAAVVAVVGATVPSQGVPPFIYFQF